MDSTTFVTTEDARYYKPIDAYEGIHRWDPEFHWTEEEEKGVIRKVIRITLTMITHRYY
jgi:hypothetical protein